MSERSKNTIISNKELQGKVDSFLKFATDFLSEEKIKELKNSNFSLESLKKAFAEFLESLNKVEDLEVQSLFKSGKSIRFLLEGHIRSAKNEREFLSEIFYYKLNKLNKIGGEQLKLQANWKELLKKVWQDGITNLDLSEEEKENLKQDTKRIAKKVRTEARRTAAGYKQAYSQIANMFGLKLDEEKAVNGFLGFKTKEESEKALAQARIKLAKRKEKITEENSFVKNIPARIREVYERYVLNDKSELSPAEKALFQLFYTIPLTLGLTTFFGSSNLFLNQSIRSALNNVFVKAMMVTMLPVIGGFVKNSLEDNLSGNKRSFWEKVKNVAKNNTGTFVTSIATGLTVNQIVGKLNVEVRKSFFNYGVDAFAFAKTLPGGLHDFLFSSAEAKEVSGSGLKSDTIFSRNQELRGLSGIVSQIDSLKIKGSKEEIIANPEKFGLTKFSDLNNIKLRTENSSGHFAEVSIPFSRQDTLNFLQLLSQDYKGDTIYINDLTRGENQFLKNASKNSPHRYGLGVDFRSIPTNLALEGLLQKYHNQGHIIYTKENNPPHYHVTVIPRVADITTADKVKTVSFLQSEIKTLEEKIVTDLKKGNRGNWNVHSLRLRTLQAVLDSRTKGVAGVMKEVGQKAKGVAEAFTGEKPINEVEKRFASLMIDINKKDEKSVLGFLDSNKFKVSEESKITESQLKILSLVIAEIESFGLKEKDGKLTFAKPDLVSEIGGELKNRATGVYQIKPSEHFNLIGLNPDNGNDIEKFKKDINLQHKLFAKMMEKKAELASRSKHGFIKALAIQHFGGNGALTFGVNKTDQNGRLTNVEYGELADKLYSELSKKFKIGEIKIEKVWRVSGILKEEGIENGDINNFSFEKFTAKSESWQKNFWNNISWEEFVALNLKDGTGADSFFGKILKLKNRAEILANLDPQLAKLIRENTDIVRTVILQNPDYLTEADKKLVSSVASKNKDLAEALFTKDRVEKAGVTILTGSKEEPKPEALNLYSVETYIQDNVNLVPNMFSYEDFAKLSSEQKGKILAKFDVSTLKNFIDNENGSFARAGIAVGLRKEFIGNLTADDLQKIPIGEIKKLTPDEIRDFEYLIKTKKLSLNFDEYVKFKKDLGQNASEIYKIFYGENPKVATTKGVKVEVGGIGESTESTRPIAEKIPTQVESIYLNDWKIDLEKFIELDGDKRISFLRGMTSGQIEANKDNSDFWKAITLDQFAKIKIDELTKVSPDYRILEQMREKITQQVIADRLLANHPKHFEYILSGIKKNESEFSGGVENPGFNKYFVHKTENGKLISLEEWEKSKKVDGNVSHIESPISQYLDTNGNLKVGEISYENISTSDKKEILSKFTSEFLKGQIAYENNPLRLLFGMPLLSKMKVEDWVLVDDNAFSGLNSEEKNTLKNLILKNLEGDSLTAFKENLKAKKPQLFSILFEESKVDTTTTSEVAIDSMGNATSVDKPKTEATPENQVVVDQFKNIFAENGKIKVGDFSKLKNGELNNFLSSLTKKQIEAQFGNVEFWKSLSIDNLFKINIEALRESSDKLQFDILIKKFKNVSEYDLSKFVEKNQSHLRFLFGFYNNQDFGNADQGHLLYGINLRNNNGEIVTKTQFEALQNAKAPKKINDATLEVFKGSDGESVEREGKVTKEKNNSDSTPETLESSTLRTKDLLPDQGKIDTESGTSSNPESNSPSGSIAETEEIDPDEDNKVLKIEIDSSEFRNYGEFRQAIVEEMANYEEVTEVRDENGEIVEVRISLNETATDNLMANIENKFAADWVNHLYDLAEGQEVERSKPFNNLIIKLDEIDQKVDLIEKDKNLSASKKAMKILGLRNEQRELSSNFIKHESKYLPKVKITMKDIKDFADHEDRTISRNITSEIPLKNYDPLDVKEEIDFLGRVIKVEGTLWEMAFAVKQK